jgi:hypothetical protein
MPSNTRAAGSLWAALIVAVPCAGFAVRASNLGEESYFGPMAYLHTAVALTAAATATGLGLYQLLAKVFAADARHTARNTPHLSSSPPSALPPSM